MPIILNKPYQDYHTLSAKNIRFLESLGLKVNNGFIRSNSIRYNYNKKTVNNL